MTHNVWRLVFLLFIAFISIEISAQNEKSKDFYLLKEIDIKKLSKQDKRLIDSSLTQYHNTTVDTLQFLYLNHIVEYCSDENIWPKYNDLLAKLVEQQIAKKNTSKKLQNKYLWFYAGTINNQANILQQKGEIPVALEQYNKALKIYESLNDKIGIAAILNNTGLIYKNQGDLEKSLEYYQRSLKIQEEVGDKVGLAKALNNLGYIYNKLEEIPKAISYYEQSLSIRQEINDKEGLAVSYNNLGSIYSREGDLNKTIEYFKKGLIIFEEINNKEGMVYTLSNLAAAQLKLNNLKEAKKLGLKAMEIANQLGYPTIVNRAAELMTEVSQELGDWKDAMKFYRLHIKMRDSIVNDENAKEIIKQQLTYKYEKQKLEAQKEQEKKDAINAKEKERQQQTIVFVILVLAVVIIFTVFLFNRFRVTRKQKKIIEEKQNEILDSLRYAKRIQDALLTSQTYIERNINRLKNNL
ncbi:MAG TPA: tetratricopeptide repeat protein [Vicingus sp.]|nr:tetratricopeptide repeat protein [Vicingus sp.]